MFGIFSSSILLVHASENKNFDLSTSWKIRQADIWVQQLFQFVWYAFTIMSNRIRLISADYNCKRTDRDQNNLNWKKKKKRITEMYQNHLNWGKQGHSESFYFYSIFFFIDEN